MRLLTCILLLFALPAGAAPPPGLAGEGRALLSPEQRREMWQRMTPEQREAFRNARTPEERARAWQGLPPRDMWQQLTPEQRELMMRRVPPDERRQLWEKMSPEEREAMRQRFLQQREGRQGGPAERPRLTPEERQRLRDQIRESQGDWRGGPGRPGQGRKDGP